LLFPDRIVTVEGVDLGQRLVAVEGLDLGADGRQEAQGGGSAEGDVLAGRGEDSVGEIGGGEGLVLEGGLSGVGDHADDFEGHSGEGGLKDAEAAAERVVAGRPVALDQGLAKEGDALAAENVLLGEGTAAEQWNADETAEVFANEQQVQAGGVAGRLAFQSKAAAKATEGREAIGDSGGLDEGEGGDTAECFLEESVASLQGGIAAGREGDDKGEDVFGMGDVAGGIEGGETADHESGARQEEEGEGNFGDHEGAGKGDVATGAMGRQGEGSEAEENGCENREDEREEQDARVDGDDG